MSEVLLHLRWLPIILTVIDFCTTWWIVEVKGGSEGWGSSKWCFLPKNKIDRFLNLVCWLSSKVLLYWEYVFVFGNLMWGIVVLAFLFTLAPVVYNTRSILRILFRSP